MFDSGIVCILEWESVCEIERVCQREGECVCEKERVCQREGDGKKCVFVKIV